jgi:rhodanese-related sulfurtransferase
MKQASVILIDLREEFELLEKQLKSTNEEVLILNIPTRAIFANKDVINDLSETSEIYVMCRSGCRSGKVKDLYFPKNENVISLKGGINDIDNSIFKEDVKVISGKGGIGVQQYVQMAFIAMFFVLLVLVHMDVNKLHMEIIIASIILFLTYQVMSKGCLIGSIVPLPK